MPESLMHNNEKPSVCIVLLNWNGKEDTLACLKSIQGLDYPNFSVILVDNASSDGSVDAARDAFAGTMDLEFIVNDDNLGFAAGTNVGLRRALEKGAELTLALNNDTVLTADSISKLVSFHQTHPEYKALTPQIRYFDRNERIWNCGGRLTCAGSKKYYFEDDFPKQLEDKGFLDITFITGCALFVPSAVYREYGLLSEDFFFGEEDYEFSLRMRERGLRMACVTDSVIYHKVSSSVDKASKHVIGKVFIHYLNRFVNLKRYMPRWKWQLWRHSYLLYVQFVLLLRHRVSVGKVLRFGQLLMRESKKRDRVDRLAFNTYFASDFTKAILKNGA
jgi:GT2 family glycosyltransferase